MTTEKIIQLLSKKKLIGKGASSIVYKVENCFTNKGFLVLKILNDAITIPEKADLKKITKKEVWNDYDDLKNSEEEEEIEIDIERIKQIFKEYEILNALKHPNIISVYGFYFGDKNHKPSILLEYCKFNLESAIEFLEDIDLVGVIYEICSAMDHVHKNKIIHRDLKPKNILINSNKHVKICNFGIAKILDETTLTSITHNNGTFLFMAPEMFQLDKIYNEKVDVYAFGVVLFFILTKGKSPILKGPGNLDNSKFPNEINNLSRGIIMKCWSISPDERPSFEELIDLIIKNQFLLIDRIESKIPELKTHLGLK